MMRYHIYRLGIAILFYAILYRRQTTAEEIPENRQADVDEYVYYQGVQGKPGVDFPIYARIPRTGFSCRQVPSGYYADLETDCQVFHICNEGKKISFLCPNGTIFQQSDLICEWWFKVNCTTSPDFYEESAEQLQEDTWRRKANRKPGYQNRIAVEQKKFKEVESAGRRAEHGRGRQPAKKFRAHEDSGYANGRGNAKHNGQDGQSGRNNHQDTEYTQNQHTASPQNQYTANPQNLERTQTQYSNNGGNYNQNTQETANLNTGNHDLNTENQYTTNPQNLRGTQTSTQYTSNQNDGSYNQNTQYTASPNKNTANHNLNTQNQYTANPQNFERTQASTHYNNEGYSNQNSQNRNSQNHNSQNQYTANPSTQSTYNSYQNGGTTQYSPNSSPSTNFKTAEEAYSRSTVSSQNTQPETNRHQTNRKDNGRRIFESNRNVVNHKVQSEIRNKQVHGSRGSMKYRSQVNLKGRNELSYDDSVEETQVPEESASFYKNNQNAIQGTGKFSTAKYSTEKYGTANTANPYPNHKETYTEVHEPKFYSTKAYITGSQTIPPQTYSTNKIPLNDGKPFVVTSPKSFYNIKDDAFTTTESFKDSTDGFKYSTETFKYSPTIPPFTTKRNDVTTILPNLGDTNTPQQEEVTFSAPYSNVVTEQLGKIKETTPNSIGYSSQVNSVSGLDDIVHTTSGDVTKDYVRITGQTSNTNNVSPDKIQLTVSSAQPSKNVQLNANYVTSTTQRPATPQVHRRYSAALSQANPNNACIDEVTTSSTSAPTSTNSVLTSITSAPTSITSAPTSITSAPTSITFAPTFPTSAPTSTTPALTSRTSKTPDFAVVVGRQRDGPTTESQLFKITVSSGNSISPEINKPRSFEKATESPIYRLDLSNKIVEKVTEAYTLKPSGFYITKGDEEGTTKFGSANTYLPKPTTQAPKQEEFNIVVKPKPFELPPKEPTIAPDDVILDSTPNYEVSSARPFSLSSNIFSDSSISSGSISSLDSSISSGSISTSDSSISLGSTIAPTQPTPFTRNPKVYENVSNMLNTIREIIKERNESEARPGLVVPPSAGPQTLHSLAVYFANALDGIPMDGEEDKDEHKKAIELLTIPTLSKYKDLFKDEEKDGKGEEKDVKDGEKGIKGEDKEVTTIESEEDSNDLEGQHTKNGVATPRVRQLAQVFTKALSSYLDDPDMFRKYLQEVRPTEPSNIATTPATTDNNTEEDELLNYSDADIKPELPRLSTTPSVSPTWGYILAPNNSNSFEYNSLSTDVENLQSADSQSFVSSFNDYIKEKHLDGEKHAKSTTPLSTDLPGDHWTTSQNATTLWRDKLYTNPQAINEDLKNPSTQPPSTEIKYELRSLPKIELNSTQVHGILIDFMNTTHNDENSRLLRILSKLNTTQEEFLTKMREIEQNPLTRRLILLLISECATNITQNHNLETADSQVQVSTLPSLFESSRIAESDKHEIVNSRIPKYVDHNLKDDDEDTRALQLLNSLYSIASRYGK